MDTEVKNTISDKLEPALEELPVEVKEFLYKGTFNQAIDAIAERLVLTDEQKKALSTEMVFVIAQVDSKDALLELTKKWGFTDKQNEEFVGVVEEYIFNALFAATNYTILDEEPPQTLSPDAFASIQERLAKPASIAPASRDYTVYNTPSTPSTAPKAEPKLDPYREMPE